MKLVEIKRLITARKMDRRQHVGIKASEGIFFSISNLSARYVPTFKSITVSYSVVAIRPSNSIVPSTISCFIFLDSQIYKWAAWHSTTPALDGFHYLHGFLDCPVAKIPSGKEAMAEVNVVFDKGDGLQFTRREVVFKY